MEDSIWRIVLVLIYLFGKGLAVLLIITILAVGLICLYLMLFYGDRATRSLIAFAKMYFKMYLGIIKDEFRRRDKHPAILVELSMHLSFLIVSVLYIVAIVMLSLMQWETKYVDYLVVALLASITITFVLIPISVYSAQRLP